MSLDKMGSFLDKVIAKKGLTRQAEASQLCFLAQEWIGGRYGKNSGVEVVSYSRTELKVRACSVLAQELMFCEVDLLEHLEKSTGKKIVKRISYQVY